MRGSDFGETVPAKAADVGEAHAGQTLDVLQRQGHGGKFVGFDVGDDLFHGLHVSNSEL
jgi:hypothetical protein